MKEAHFKRHPDWKWCSRGSTGDKIPGISESEAIASMPKKKAASKALAVRRPKLSASLKDHPNMREETSDGSCQAQPIPCAVTSAVDEDMATSGSDEEEEMVIDLKCRELVNEDDNTDSQNNVDMEEPVLSTPANLPITATKNVRFRDSPVDLQQKRHSPPPSDTCAPRSCSPSRPDDSSASQSNLGHLSTHSAPRAQVPAAHSLAASSYVTFKNMVRTPPPMILTSSSPVPPQRSPVIVTQPGSAKLFMSNLQSTASSISHSQPQPHFYTSVMNLKSGNLAVTSSKSTGMVVPSVTVDPPSSPALSSLLSPVTQEHSLLCAAQPKFVLAPTPAQLGITRNKKLNEMVDTSGDKMNKSSNEENEAEDQLMREENVAGNEDGIVEKATDNEKDKNVSASDANAMDSMDQVLEEVNFEKRFAQLPEFKPDNKLAVASTPTTPLTNLSPMAFVQSYRKKQRLESNKSGSIVSTPLASTPLSATSLEKTPRPNTPLTSAQLSSTPDAIQTDTPTDKSLATTGNTFFGPNFDISEAIASTTSESEVGNNSSSLPSATTPGSPRTPGEYSFG